jgi:hypothetical protein
VWIIAVFVQNFLKKMPIKNDDDLLYSRSASKTFGAVIPILGITWVFGVMAFNESSVVFQYIFAITNSIQVS